MADNIIFEDLLTPKEEVVPIQPILTEKTKSPYFLNGHLITEGTSYIVEEPHEV